VGLQFTPDANSGNQGTLVILGLWHVVRLKWLPTRQTEVDRRVRQMACAMVPPINLVRRNSKHADGR
jgi:hypothetical protein